VSLKELVSWLSRSCWGQFLREICPQKKCTPKSGRYMTAIAWKLLNGRIKQNRSKGIDMRYYWLRDRVTQGLFNVQWEPGKFNLADYFTKHHPPAHHRALRPVYLFDLNCIPDLQGCIKISGSRATGKLAAARTSPVTKSGTKSGAKSGSKSGPNSSRGSKSGINHSTGGIQSSMVQSPTKSGSNTSTCGTQSSLVLAMLIKELKAYQYSAVA
jgi:hypothetical protein